MERGAHGYTSSMYAPGGPEGEIEDGFGKIDPWPSQRAHSWHQRSRSGRGLVLLAVVLAAAVTALGVIELFTMWFGPCLHGAC